MILAALVAGAAAWFALWSSGSPPGSGPAPGHRPPVPRHDPLGVALAMDLLAAALAAGSTMPDALRAVAASGVTYHGEYLDRVAQRLGGAADPQEAWTGAPTELEPLRRVVELVVAAGVPAAGLLRAGAQEARRRAAAEAQIRAARLGVRLVLPLGLCALPAFVAWSVIPVVLGLGGRLLG